LRDVGLNKVKIIRRSGSASNIQNQWNVQGNRNSYDNVISAGIPTVTAVNATGGLSTSGAIFTYGLLYFCYCLPPSVSLTVGGPVAKISLFSPINYFLGYVRPLTYSAVSSDTNVATVSFIGDTLITTPISAGTATAIVTAIDANGSQAYLQLIIDVQTTATVSGIIAYASITVHPISGVTVTLTPTTGDALTATSNASGAYSFVNVSTGTYALSASKTGNWGGTTGLDALLVAKHAAGIALLAGLPLAAADANSNSSVTAVDALLIVRRAVGLDASFAAGDWIFASQQVVVSNTNVTANISGLCVGDVNASYTPSSGSAFTKDNILIPIQFGLPKEEPVTIEIYNALGEKKRTLIHNEVMSAGIHQMEWNGKDDAGISVTSGVYLYRINAGTFQVTKKMMMLK
jgi:hypothetical protein